MAVQSAVAQLWLQKTGCPICEGYGLSETSPTVSCNPVTSTEFSGTIGVPLPSTYLKLVDDDGNDVTELGARGELAIKGPQVMADRKSTRLNSSHQIISYAVFCLQKKKIPCL